MRPAILTCGFAAANSSVSNQGADGRDVDNAASMTLCHHRRANDPSGKKAARQVEIDRGAPGCKRFVLNGDVDLTITDIVHQNIDRADLFENALAGGLALLGKLPYRS